MNLKDIFTKPKYPTFLVKTQNTILSAAFVLAATSGINAVLGLFKNRILAAKFGVSDDLAIFYTADRIPSLIYSILVIGALSTVFIPVFTGLMKKSKDRAFEVASALINVTFGFFLLLSLIMFVFSPQIINGLALGKFSDQDIFVGVQIMRILLLGQMLLVAGSLATCILQSYKYFFLPALAPVIYNVGMIGGIAFLSEQFGIFGPAIGTVLGGFLHLVIQLPLIKKTGFTYKVNLNYKTKEFYEVVSLVPARVLSVLIANVMGTINNSLAILISTSSVVYLKFGIQLQTFPVTFIGASLAAASLPTLSQESATENCSQFKKTFLTSFHQMMFLVVPMSVGLLVLRVPAIRLVYGVSNFPWEATVETAQVLAFFSLSIFSQSAIYLITRAFYALKDTMTPVKVSLITIVINVAISLFFILKMNYGVWAVALSYSLTSIIDAFAMFYLLSKKVGGFGTGEVVKPLAKITLAAALMGITLYVPMKFLDNYVLDTSHTLDLVILSAVATASGLGTYLLFTHWLKVEEIELFYKLLRKLNIKANIPQIFTQTEEN